MRETLAKSKFRILILTKRQYANKDLIDDHFGRIREVPFELARMGHQITGNCLSYKQKNEGCFKDGYVCWQSINAGYLKISGLFRFLRKANTCSKSAELIWACSDSFYGIIGYALSRKYRIPLIFDLYDNFEYFLAAKLPIIKQLYRLVIRNCNAVTCVSNPLAELVKNTYGKKKGVFIIENAVRKDLFKPLNRLACRNILRLPQKGEFIGTAGALTDNRGIKNLFEAFFQLRTLHPDLHLVIAGPRDVVIPRDKRIHDLGLLPLETVPFLFNALDAAVICVKDDDFGKYCFPQKAREIMACNIPLVAAKTGCLADMFAAHPEWLYEPGNVDSLTKALDRRISDKSTGYLTPPSWKELAQRLEQIFIQVWRDR